MILVNPPEKWIKEYKKNNNEALFKKTLIILPYSSVKVSYWPGKGYEDFDEKDQKWLFDSMVNSIKNSNYFEKIKVVLFDEKDIKQIEMKPENYYEGLNEKGDYYLRLLMHKAIFHHAGNDQWNLLFEATVKIGVLNNWYFEKRYSIHPDTTSNSLSISTLKYNVIKKLVKEIIDDIYQLKLP